MRKFNQHYRISSLLFLLFCLGCIQQKKSIIGVPTIEVKSDNPPPKPYYHVLITGQSLSTGSWGVDSISGTFSDTQPYDNYMLSQPASSANLQGPLGTIAPLIPLVEPYYEYAIKRSVETPATGMANTIAALDDPINPSYSIISTTHGFGAQPYSQLKKNPVATAPPFLLRYSIGQQQVEKAYQEITTNPIFSGGVYHPLGVVVVHGETDQRNGEAANYEGYLNEFQADYQTDLIQFLQANNEPLITDYPMFITQMNSRGPSQMAIAQLDASKNNRNIHMVCPTYQYIYFDKTHLNGAAEYRHLGEMIGKVVHKVGVQKQAWKPLSPEKVTLKNQLISIDFHVPVGSLVFDAPPHSIDSFTGVKTYYKNYGFEYQDDSNSAKIAVNGISISPTQNTVYIYLDAVPTGANPRIKYAAQEYPRIPASNSACCRSGDLANGIPCYGGNLRDSDNSVSPAIDGSGMPLYNWCVTFDEPLQTDIIIGAILQGPYNDSTGLMTTGLVDNGILPLKEPFTALGYTFVNSEEIGTTIAPSVLNAIEGDRPVDWVTIEVLNSNKDSVIQAQTGILQSDGDIVDPSGVSNGVRLDGMISLDYHLKIKHRNHLAVSTMRPIRINRHTSPIDFSTSTNTTYQKSIGGVKGLWAGDANQNQRIDETDRTRIENQSGSLGYIGTDINLDGIVSAKDRSLSWNNRKILALKLKQDNK